MKIVRKNTRAWFGRFPQIASSIVAGAALIAVILNRPVPTPSFTPPIVTDVLKYSKDKRRITYDGKILYQVPSNEIDAEFEGPIVFSDQVFFIDCERNEVFRIANGRIISHEQFAASRASILKVGDWGNYGTNSIILTTKGILVWTRAGNAFMLTDTNPARRIRALDTKLPDDCYPSEFILDKPLSGIVNLKCSVGAVNDYILTVDLDQESKVRYAKNNNP